MIQLKILATKTTAKIVLDINIFKKGGEMSWRLLDNHKSMGCLTAIVWSYAFMKEMAYLSKSSSQVEMKKKRDTYLNLRLLSKKHKQLHWRGLQPVFR